jgi:hypothetical protein
MGQGFGLAIRPMESSDDSSSIGTILNEIFGSLFKRLQFVHLSFTSQLDFGMFDL